MASFGRVGVVVAREEHLKVLDGSKESFDVDIGRFEQLKK